MVDDNDVLCQFPRSQSSPFCEDHGCVEAGCRSKRDQRDQRDPAGEDLQRCGDHRCAVQFCPNLRREHGHCAAHTCASPDCQARVPGPGTAAGAGRFCDLHRQCRLEGCDEPVKRRRADGPVGVALALCREHGCGAEECAEQRPLTGDFCRAHECSAPECRAARRAAQRRRGGGGARGEDGQEAGDELGPGYYCRQHECAEQGCWRPRTHGRTCREHQGCARAGCANFVEADERGDVCRQHRLGPCHFIDRAGDVTAPCPRRAEPDARHCALHLCAVRGCRRERPHAGAEYCAAHGCRRGDCRGRAAGDAGLCGAHAREAGPAPAPGGACAAM
ncbi:uncharacterized protein HRG_02266 [Hirsutella rhossiliensis]|uniref:Uncharacterized protein n=1 Tax=Hirsutella rhossiliensis TaxID=111463 RepID=A0A9P8N4L8_9HYPO|nr:uncharacterized protein HRG_02266 [Hirsutella rhossiliensis]KAH0966857.1 hypothetical protein HRG_02266 [Hirsutella rhossiliensis]